MLMAQKMKPQIALAQIVHEYSMIFGEYSARKKNKRKHHHTQQPFR